MRRRRPPHAKDHGRRDALLGVLLLLVVVVAGYLSTVAIDGGPLEDPYTVRIAVPEGAPLLKDGDDVRIAGERAGTVRGVKAISADEPGSGGVAGTLVSVDLDAGPVGVDARATVRLRGVAGAVYVDLRPGDASRPLADGGLVRGPAAAATQLTDVAAIFDAGTRRALRSTVQGVGEGLKGRGDEVNHALAALPDTLERTTPLARAANPTPGALGGLLGSARPVLRAADADGDLARTAPALRRVVAGIPGGALRDTVRDLPPAQTQLRGVLPEADRLLQGAGATAEALRPLTASLRTALPPLTDALGGTPGIQAFRRLGASARPVLAAATPVLRDARDPAALLSPLATPLGPLTSYLAPYHQDIVEAVAGFNRWGDFAFDDGAAKGARAVRFSLVLTCHRNRDPYPAPGEASKQRKACQK